MMVFIVPVNIINIVNNLKKIDLDRTKIYQIISNESNMPVKTYERNVSFMLQIRRRCEVSRDKWNH